MKTVFFITCILNALYLFAGIYVAYRSEDDAFGWTSTVTYPILFFSGIGMLYLGYMGQ